MKRALTIFLLLFFLADAVGFMLFLFVDWYELKKEMTHLLNAEEFEKNAVTLTLDEEEFGKVRWIETDREFFYKGKLYDMVSLTRLPGNKSKIRCVEDEREAELFELMQQMIDLDQPTQNHQRTFILTVFKFLSDLVVQLFSFPLRGPGMSSLSGDAYLNRYHFSYSSILIQPPDQVSFSI